MRETPALDRLRSADPPTASDSDLIAVTITRLQRAVVKMQAREYDDELQEHLERAAEFLGWVATNIWMREERDSESTAPACDPSTGGDPDMREEA